MHIKSLVKEMVKVPAGEILPHPMNWRTHPVEQLDALRSLMAEIGFTTPVLVRKLESGQFQALDGHARIETLPAEHQVDCVVVDCDEKTALKILATHDPVSAMAGKDMEMLERLSSEIEFVNPAAQQLLTDLLTVDAVEGDEEEPAAEEDDGDAVIASQFQILINFETERQQGEWLEKLMAQGLKCRSLIS